MTHFSPHYLPNFQDIREFPAIRKVLSGLELSAADKMALKLRAAEIESAVGGDGEPLSSALRDAVKGGFMPKEMLDGGYFCNEDDSAFMAVEDAAETLHRYRHLDGLVNRGRLRLTEDEDALHEFQSLQTQLQYLAGNVLDVVGGWGDFAEPDVIVAEHIEKFYSGVTEGGEVRVEALWQIAKKFRHGQEQAAREFPSRRHVMVSFKRGGKGGADCVFKVEGYSDVHDALCAIHDAFNEAEDEKELSDVEVAFTDGDFLPQALFHRIHSVSEEGMTKA